MRSLLVLFVSASVLGCDGYRKDVETVCTVRSRVKAEPGAETDAIKAYLFTNIRSPKAKKTFLSMGSLSDAEKVALLRREARAAGVEPCPLADEVEAALKAPPPVAPPAPVPDAG